MTASQLGWQRADGDIRGVGSGPRVHITMQPTAKQVNRNYRTDVALSSKLETCISSPITVTGTYTVVGTVSAACRVGALKANHQKLSTIRIRLQYARIKLASRAYVFLFPRLSRSIVRQVMTGLSRQRINVQDRITTQPRVCRHQCQTRLPTFLRQPAI